MNWPNPWRAWHTFQAALVGALMVLTMDLGVAGLARVRFGELNEPQIDLFLAVLYWGTYPLVFTALGALAWHAARSERGDYA